MHQPRRILVTFISSLLLVSFMLPAIVSAESPQKLVTRLPGNNQLLVGVDAATAKTSPFYKEVMQWVRTQSNLSDLLTLMETEGGFNIETDLQSVAMVSPEVPAGVDGALKMPFTAAMSGKFDRDKVTAAIKSHFPNVTERKEAKLTILAADKHEISFIDDKTFVIVSGPKTYLANSWKGLSGKKSAHNANFKAIVADVVAKHSIWVLMDSSSMISTSSQGAKAKFSAIAFRAVDNLAITMLSHFQDAKDAEQALQETEKMKVEAQSNPMIAMTGLGPLLKNMAIKQDKSKVWITSSMTVAETRALLTRFQAIAASSQSLKTSPLTKKTPKTEAPITDNDAVSKPTPKKSGAAADFN